MLFHAPGFVAVDSRANIGVNASRVRGCHPKATEDALGPLSHTRKRRNVPTLGEKRTCDLRLHFWVSRSVSR